MTITQIYQLFKRFPQVVTDSRKTENGAIFFALKGKKFNGNKYAADALNKGASFAVIDEKEYFRHEKTILVNDVLQTLQELALFHRKALGIPVLAITGSNGKTTTKELVAAVLSKKYNIIYTQGNLNNHIGLPLTLLRMDKKTELGVVEMGANHPGEIGLLCSIADPDYGIITNIGQAHLEGFGSFEMIKQTKAELYSYLKNKNGTIFFNCSNPILSDLVKGIRHKVSYGENEGDLKGEPVQSPPFIHANAHFPEGVVHLKTKLPGKYNFENVMAAACIGQFFGIEAFLIQEAINHYQPTNNRSQLIEKSGLKIIMDAYNANPSSMQASIESFLSGFYIPRSLILGDMFELGENSISEHISILEIIKKHSFSEVFLVGPVFTEVAKNEPFKSFKNTGLLCSYLAKNPIKEGAVLIKGSRGVQLEKVLEYI
jgi:UDP-N-acetylmuramoyl-tripeptide--D-alanyl-D-alanine ligase